MIDPSAALTAAMIAALRGSDDVASAMSGQVRVYDVVPSAAPFPYIATGDLQVLPYDFALTGPEGSEVFATVHVWSRTDPVGRSQARLISGATRDALGTELPLDGHRVVIGRLHSMNHFMDPDDRTAHSVLVFRYETSPA